MNANMVCVCEKNINITNVSWDGGEWLCFLQKKLKGVQGRALFSPKKETDGCANEGYKKVCSDQLLSM
jgi:hypothetical protein